MDIEVAPGRLTLLAGPSGSGKSTVVRLLAGLIEPADGFVELDGAAPHPASVGCAFQRPRDQLFESTVQKDIELGPRCLGAEHADAQAVAQRAAHAVGLDLADIAQRSPFALSGGEARRVALAGVLANQTRVVVFDEPTCSLDAPGVRHMVELVDDLRARGVGVLVATHDLWSFTDVADEVVLMEEGRVVWHGAPSDEMVQHLSSPAWVEGSQRVFCTYDRLRGRGR